MPFSAKYPDVQDWDDPDTCILWDNFRRVVQHIRQHGTPPEQHSSHDHLNKQQELDVEEEDLMRCRTQLEVACSRLADSGTQITWVIVDGFVLFWDTVSAERRDHTPADFSPRTLWTTSTFAYSFEFPGQSYSSEESKGKHMS